VYTSPFTSIAYDGTRRQLNVTWHSRATELDEEGVKNEIAMILEMIRERSVINILVDTVHYPFRENSVIQSWINYTYLPKVMDSGVKRYAIVVKDKVKNWYENIEADDPEGLRVEYFTDPFAAQAWIDKG
jgi:DNA phosphorothioation-dependent restriction protein DptG